MVHLIFNLNHKGNANVEALMKEAEDYIKSRRNYTMFNYWTDGTSTDDKSNPFNKSYLGYVRENHDPDDKDQYNCRKAYQEYGWHSDAEREWASFQGQRGVQIEGRFFPAPGYVQYTWKVRQMTDWTDYDMEQFNTHIITIIQKYDFGFKAPNQYSDEDVSEYMRALDFGFTSGNLMRHHMTQKIIKEGGKTATYADGTKYDPSDPKCGAGDCSWICSICLGGLSEDPTTDNHSYKNNADPISTDPCCEACNTNWVIPARMGCNPYEARAVLPNEQWENHVSPFKYPVPEGFQFSEVGDVPFVQSQDTDWMEENLQGGRMNDKRFIELQTFSMEAKVNELVQFGEMFKKCQTMMPHKQGLLVNQIRMEIRAEEKKRRDYMEMTPEMAQEHADQVKEVAVKMEKVKVGEALSQKIEAKFKKANMAKAMMEQKCQRRITGMKSDNERKTSKIEELKKEINRKEELDRWENEKLQEQEAWSEMDTRIQDLIEEKRLDNDDKTDIVSVKSLVEAWDEWNEGLSYKNAVEYNTDAFQSHIESIYGGIHKLSDKQKMECDGALLDEVIATWAKKYEDSPSFNM